MEGVSVRGDLLRRKRQPQHLDRFRRGIKGGILDPPGAVADGINYRAGADDVVLAARAIVPLLDHLVIAGGGRYTSMLDQGVLGS